MNFHVDLFSTQLFKTILDSKQQGVKQQLKNLYGRYYGQPKPQAHLTSNIGDQFWPIVSRDVCKHLVAHIIEEDDKTDIVAFVISIRDIATH